MKTILSIGSMVGFVSLLAVAGYAWSNKSGHTGADPYALLFLFLPLLLAGLLGLRYQRVRRHAVIAIGIAVSGIVLLLVLDRTNALVEYHTWLKRGMPEKGEGS